MAITTSLDKFRLELGDTPAAYGLTPEQDEEFQAAALYNDQEAAYFIAAHPSSVLLAVAAAADALALRFAREFDMAEDGQSFDRSQKSKMYAALAKSLRARAASEVAAAQDGAGIPIGRVPARCPTTWASRF